MAATRTKSGRFKKTRKARKSAKGSRKRKSTRGHAGLAARVTKLEHATTKLQKDQKTIVAVVHAHQRALVSGGLLAARAAKQLPR